MRYFIFLLLLVLLSCEYGTEVMPHSETCLSIVNLNTNEVSYITNIKVGGFLKFTSGSDRVLIMKSSGFYIVDIDGSNLTSILDYPDISDSYYNVSPTEDLVIFSDGEDIYTFNYVDSSISNLTEDFDLPSTYPSFSLDGQKIIFSTLSNYNENQVETSLVTMNSDGSSKLTIFEDIDSTYYRIKFPIFFSDLSKVAYINGGLIICNVDGSELELINSGWINNPITEANNSIIYERSNRVYSYDVLNAEINLLANGEAPRVSYDGTKIAYINDGLRIMNTDGTNNVFLAESRSQNFSFSFDNSRLLFWGDIITHGRYGN